MIKPTKQSPGERQDSPVDFAMVLASSVHDMKNSLGMLLNSLQETMQDMPARTPAQHQRFATLQYEASRINGELIQLLALYRMNQQAMPLHVEENFVRDLLDEQLARNDNLFVSRRLQVECLCPDDLVGYFDYELVAGVVHNILVNGARYTRSRLKITASAHQGGLKLLVEDDGQGYPPAMLEQPVLAAGVSFETGSTNLGLYFAQKVASLHRSRDLCGHIALTNGGSFGGSVFELFLP